MWTSDCFHVLQNVVIFFSPQFENAKTFLICGCPKIGRGWIWPPGSHVQTGCCGSPAGPGVPPPLAFCRPQLRSRGAAQPGSALCRRSGWLSTCLSQAPGPRALLVPAPALGRVIRFIDRGCVCSLLEEMGFGSSEQLPKNERMRG